MADDESIFTLPFLPVKNTVLFPHLVLPLSVRRPNSLKAIDKALSAEEKEVVIFAQRDPAVEEPEQDDMYGIGTRAVIKKMARSEGAVELFVYGLERVAMIHLDTVDDVRMAKVRSLPAPEDTGTEVEAIHRAVREQLLKIDSLVQTQGPVSLSQMLDQFSDPLAQVYLLGSLLPLDLEKEQALLEAATRREALELMFGYLQRETEVLEIRQKITSQAHSEMSKEQREYILRQQLRAIQQELGEENPQQAELQELRKRFEEADLPEEIRKETEREMARLAQLPPTAPDYQLTRGYLELVVELPWRKYTEDNLDLQHARKILDDDHYDLRDVKDRIIEHLSVMKLNPEANAPIICFVGPPGVGKTSLGESIARALGRKFERISVGGLHDEAELRGHRRTYIGAMPGRIIQGVRRAGVSNPLLMLDEIDKLGRDFRGDPAAALMEILDPAQNSTFQDNFLNLPYDLSKVFFLTTANTLDTIPRPLLDRMEVLRLSGYTDEEKVQIARKYLLPRQRKQAGLSADQIEIPDETLHQVIRRYTREAGLRELERTIGRICRKVAVRVAEGNQETFVVQPDDLVDLLGPGRLFAEQARKQLPPGVATGLAWTEAGGDVLYIEAIYLPGARGLTLTGQLGDVMKESAQAAHSYVRSQSDRFGVPVEKFTEGGVHLHVPAGAIPKDGPSAGITMATALTSLYTGIPVRSDTAMTGEITLTGLVFPIGGVKEKALAAHRAGLSRVVLPKENEKDLADLPDNLRNEMEFIFAETIEDVLCATIPELTTKKG